MELPPHSDPAVTFTATFDFSRRGECLQFSSEVNERLLPLVKRQVGVFLAEAVDHGVDRFCGSYDVCSARNSVFKGLNM